MNRRELLQGRPLRGVSLQLLLIISILVTFNRSAASIELSDDRLTFTRASYNVSIPENCVGKTYARPQERMGILATPEVSVRYKIVSGDKDKHFKAEAKQVGDFWYLLLRIRTENSAVLNREYQEHYKLKVRGTLQQKSRKLYDVHCDVLVTILDKNDISPLFYPKTYNVTVSEMTPLFKNILKVNADDPDEGVNGEIYYNLAEPSNVFAIHPTLGSVSVTRPLDYRKANVFNLTVEARDRGPKLGTDTVIKASTARVTINLSPANRHRPQIIVKNLQSYIEHGVGPETWAAVQVSDQDVGVNGEIGGLAITDGDIDGQFRVHQIGAGEYNIDFDPRNGATGESRGYNLTLRAWDKGSHSLYTDQSVFIRVRPSLGAITPVFNKEDYDVQIDEVAPPNSPMIRVSAHLPHEEKHNDVIVYRIETGDEDGVFEINSKTGQISTNKWLDREQRRYYSLTVSASNTKSRSTRHRTGAAVATTIVNINVLDCNDNAPRFNQSIQSVVTIDENVPIGTKVVTVSATDADDEENGYVTFALANTNKVPFKINPFTGVVSTIDSIDYEKMSSSFYLLRIRATDWGTPFQRQTEMTVRVQVRDLNDHRPQFEKVDCAVSINSQTPIGTAILTLSAIDLDQQDQVQYKYRMKPASIHQCFSLDSRTGILSVACDSNELVDLDDVMLNITATDGEHFSDSMHVKVKIEKYSDSQNHLLKSRKEDKFKPHVECREAGLTKSLREFLSKRVSTADRGHDQIEDTLISHSFFENRFAPEFPKDTPVEISVNESVPVGTVLLPLRAKDADHGYNGRIVYVISSGDDDSCFKMDLYKGNLVLVEPLDRERTPKYVLTVTAYDLGEPKKSASISVVVYVLDVNDNPPIFEKSLYTFKISEAVNKGAVMVKLRATDADEGENAKIRYKLSTETDDFIVDEKAGILIVHRNLDRERQAEYNLMVKATDSSIDLPLTGTTMVNIQVQDVNDERPRFTLKNYIARVREDLPKGTVIMTMAAQDPDLDEAGRVVYQMMNKELRNLFEIDSETGIVRLIGELDFETNQLYNVTIRASDQGEPKPLHTDTFLLVEVEDVNENRHAPKFADVVVQASVDENQPPGAFVITVTATDDDDPTKLDGMITYSIIDGDGLGLFSIDDKGTIRSRSVLDCENKPYYWLVVSAMDRAAVPLSSRLDVYVKVNDVNDNAPLSKLPYYKGTVLEDSPGNVSVLGIEAFDNDHTANMENITFKITAGDANGNFHIDEYSGRITTTDQKLDRETQDKFLLDVTITDDGTPALSSVTQVLIHVGDINDHDPKFTQVQYRFKILEQEELKEQVDLAQVIATDDDTGANSELAYSIIKGATFRFSIDQQTGMIRSRSALLKDEIHELHVKVSDLGEVPRHSTCVVMLQVASKPSTADNRPPKIKSVDVSEVFEVDKVGHVVAMISALDLDLHSIYFRIVSGNEKKLFALKKPDEGAVIVARPIVQSDVGAYTLGVEVTDGLAKTYTEFNITVIDDNNQYPEFIEETYTVEVSELVAPGTEILKIKAVDKDLNDQLFYAIHNAAATNSLQKFHLAASTGVLQVAQPLDHEETREHIITALAKDSGWPGKRAYVRIHIHVADHNDHAPEFLQSSFEGKVFESAALGTSVVQTTAVDKDRGDNARISYSIVSGNVGSSFTIQPQLGTISVAKSLSQQLLPEYYLVVRAADHGSPSLNSTVTVHIKVTMATNAPPKFEADTKVVEVEENKPIGTPVVVTQAQSGSALYYDISLGNDEGCFSIDQNSGIVTTACVLDYEQKQQYLIIVRATNLVNSWTEMALTIHVVDVNDNAPVLEPRIYFGTISEAAEPPSVVMTNESLPLVVTATDADRDINAHLSFAIVDTWARRYFRIDPSTGSISAAHRLDRELRSSYSFSVEVCDNGRPTVLCSRGPARVSVEILDVNDSPPVFEKDFYNVTLVLPTHRGVTVAELVAHDADIDPVIKYSIIGGNIEEHFLVDPVAGLVKVNQPDSMLDFYRLVVAAHDGLHERTASLHINVVKSPMHGNPSFRFSYPQYESRVVENSDATKAPLLVLSTVGTRLQEPIHFKLLNEEAKFVVGETSGALTVRPGTVFDREQQANYRLVVNAIALATDRVASTLIDVTIEDVNDNAPTFVDTPYHCVVPIESNKGEQVQRVRAEDPDDGANGRVLYYLRDLHKGVFDIDSKTGNITLRKRLPSHMTQYTITVVAKDEGNPPMYSEVQVPVKVVTRTMPSFQKQFYSAHVKENHLPSEPVLTLIAQSPGGKPLIYDITEGHHKEDFRLDYQAGPNTASAPCVLYVNEELDFDKTAKYDLTVRATDSLSGAHSDVSVTIHVEDVNNHPPLFEQIMYNVSVSEVLPPGSSILTVRAHDKDSNSVIHYSVEDSDRFMIDSKTGVISLRRSLDYERHSRITLTVMATDSGPPQPLSSTALVFIQVTDINDSPPVFDRPVVDCSISQLARRGQFVAHLGASDPDFSQSVLSVHQTLARFPDQFSSTPSLAYQIISGSQAFTVDRYTGIVSVGNLHFFRELVKSEQDVHALNVSVTDGVFVAFCKLKVHIVPANSHSPKFTHFEYEAIVPENSSASTYIITVSATDQDRGQYGRVKYFIQSEEMTHYFTLDQETGELRTKRTLDREKRSLYKIAIVAEDGGARIGHSVVRVTVTDENDNPPQFLLPEYRCNVKNFTAGQAILKVTATDKDLLPRGLKYSFRDGDPQNITESFGIVEDNGEIFLKKPLKEGARYQFFVKVSDGVFETMAPVVVVALHPNQKEPHDSNRIQDLYVKENAKIPTVITTLNDKGSGDVKYELISTENEISLFTVDRDTGRVTAIRSLDREECSKYHIGIKAESRSTGLISQIQINVIVTDENDNKPDFESGSGGYVVRLAENIPVGSKIIRLVANDVDIDSNGVVTYDFYERNDPAADIFQIDTQTGWITNLIALDRESVPSYNLTVVARDNGSPLKQYSTSTVFINVVDYNDNPPTFSRDLFEVEVDEDAPVNTEIFTLEIQDPDDPKSQTMYFYLTSGDDRNHFGLSDTGVLFVRHSLDRESQEHYIVDIAASDGLHVANTKVSIRLRDANDNGPVCMQSKYIEQVKEDVSPGSYILTVAAKDADIGINAVMRFSLRGKGHEQFVINSTTGELRVSKALDRETQSSYSLTAHVQDSQHMEWSCTSSIRIMVSDINDCPPQFSKDNYTVAIQEDAEIGTVLMKIYATDRDVGINRKVSYSLMDNAGGYFEIQSNTGIIQLMKTLDREAVDSYRLSVEAIDHGQPKLSSAVSVNVVVLDVNDNPPEFTKKMYFANISEMAPHGTHVAQVKAFSRDIGINAEISYKLENAENFDIDPESGIISVMRSLDYEAQAQYMLSVVAQDGGTPALSSTSLLNVTVLDFNDNKPTFDKGRYNSVIREDTKVGERILQIQATDADSGINGELSYAIVNATDYPEFVIDPRSGVVVLRKNLDREQQSDYYFLVVAHDGGEPELNETVEVSITLSDINDNAPQFVKGGNYSAIVQEGKRDQKVIDIQVTDKDTPANAGPFTLTILNGNFNSDFVVRGMSIFTHGSLNTERRAEYNLQIQVSDAGTPSLSSKTNVHIKVIEESKYPPDVDSLHVYITSYLDDFPGGFIGKIHASDLDPYDKLKFELSDKENALFTVDREEGIISAQNGLDVGSYVVNVSVSDAKFTTETQVIVDVSLITEDALTNAVILTLADVTPEDFLLTYQKGFQSGLKILFGLKKQNVHIISIQPSIAVSPSNNSIEKRSLSKRSTSHRDNLDILFAVRKNQLYYDAAIISQKLRENQALMDKEIDRKILHISQNRCRDGMCVNGVCSDTVELDRSDLQGINTDRVSFVSPRHYPMLECICQPGFGGPKCENPINECSKNPCIAPKVCIPSTLQATGYTCQCPENTGGPLCNETCAESNLETCYIERHPLNFDERSYAHYELNHGIEKRLMFSGRVRTFQQSGVILYAAGPRDYAILEVHNGKVQFRFDCGSGEGLVRVSHKTITDGKWHHIILERRGNFARVSVDRKWEASGVSPGSHDILNLDEKNSLFIGAVLVGYYRDEIRRGFFGCMDDIKVNSVWLPLHVTGSSNVAQLKRFVNVQFKCKDPLPNPGACGAQPCRNGGTCLLGLNPNNFTCVCNEPRFKGSHCEVDTDPCASNPCLFGTLCTIVLDGKNNDFQCECPPQLSGKRCEYGQYCNPNPCQNKGVCEEGETGFTCRCPIGYRGERCQYDIDECLHPICARGATCINLLGGFECVCPPNVTGPFCSEHLQPPLIISSRLNTTVEELVGIVSVVSLVFLLALLTVCFFRYQFKKHRRMHLQSQVMLQGATGDSLDYCSNKKQKKKKHQQTAEQCQMADLLLDIAGKTGKLDGGSMMNNLDKQPMLNVQTTQLGPDSTMTVPTTPQSILRHPRSGDPYLNKDQMYAEDKIKNCSIASAASQPGLRYDDLQGYSWDYSDLTAEQRALTSNIPEHVPAINDEVNSLLSSTESNSHSNLTALGLSGIQITPPPPTGLGDLSFTTSSPVQLGFEDQSVLYNRGLNDYLPPHALSRDTSINSECGADFVSYGFPQGGGKGFVLNTLNPPSNVSDGSSTSDDNTDNTVVRRVHV